MSDSIDLMKLDLIQWITRLNNIDIIKEIDKIKQSNDIYILNEFEEKSILNGLKDIENGNLIEHSEVRKIYEKYL